MDATLLLKASLVLSATLLAGRLLRDAPAVTRHRYWSVALGAVLLLPFLRFTLPAISIPTPAGWEIAASRPADEPRQQTPAHIPLRTGTARWHEPPLAAATERPAFAWDVASAVSVRSVMVSAWAIGTCVAVAMLLLSLLRVRRVSSAAQTIADPAWREAACGIGARLGFRRPVRLMVSEGVTTPMAGGLWRPAVFLPASSRAWTTDQRDVVLAHEMAHLASRDPLRHLLARLAVAVYWFHPLVWIAARQANVAREEACDAAVLALGTRPSVYARVLLDLADAMQPRPRLLAALPMVQRSLLETRLMMILKDTRPVTRPLGAIPVFVVGFLTLAVAAAQPAVPAITPDVAPASVTTAPDAVEPTASPNHDAPASDRDCWEAGFEGSFSGHRSTSEVAGRTVIHEQAGTRGTDRIIQKSFGDLRLCMVAEDVEGRETASLPSQWLGGAARVLMEARRGSLVQQLEADRQGGAGLRITWRAGGRERPFDAAAQQWRDRMLAVFDTTWELSALRGHVSSLRGEVSSIRGEESSLRGEISSLRGEVSSMRGRISSVRGEESSLRGQISSIHGQVSSLRGAISSERGAISSLHAGRYRAGDAASIEASISRHEAEIARIEQEIRAYNAEAKIAAVEREIASLDSPGKVAAIEAEIRAFDLDGKVAQVERQIAALDVDGKVAAIERRIEALDADRRGRQLEGRRDAELKQLDAAIAAVR